MARQEASNTFQDGLISDLHPLNTPNTVLTDCLNGTIITYNGNEFILQNDMGNYELQNCKLKPNFIPVGIKGYGDILYIVSYNPITKQTEIGSYPAPQSRMSVEQETNKENVNTDYYTLTGTNNYTTVLKDDKELSIFIDSSNEESMKLYPGDEFQLIKSDEANPDFYWQALNYYVIDENKKQYDIDDTIINENIEEKTKVFWEVPGWLANKWVILVPQKFTLNIRNIELPLFISDNVEQIDTTIALNTQITVEDSQFINVYNKHPDDVGIKYEIIISSDEDNVIEQEVWNLNKHNYNDDTLTLYNNWSTAVSAELNNNITIRATPGVRSGTRILWYDQFTTDFSFSLNSIKDVSDITIADSVYKWQIDDNSCTVTFNVNGPFINSDNYRAYYRLRRWNEQKKLTNDPNLDIHTIPSTLIDNRDDFKDDYSTETILTSNINFTWVGDWTPISNFIPYGENIIDIPFSTNNAEFYREAGLYDFSILITELDNIETQNTDEIIGTPLKQVNLLLIPSVTFNNFYNDRDNYMTQVDGSEWISKYMNYVDLSQFKLYSWEQALDDEGEPIFNPPKNTSKITSSEYNDYDRGNYKYSTKNDEISDWLVRHPFVETSKTFPDGIMKPSDYRETLYSSKNINTLKYIFTTDAISININGNAEVNYLGKGYVQNSLWNFYNGEENKASITYDLKNGGVRVFTETIPVNTSEINMQFSPELSIEAEVTYNLDEQIVIPQYTDWGITTSDQLEEIVTRDGKSGVQFLDTERRFNSLGHDDDRSVSGDKGYIYARNVANSIGDNYGLRIMRITISPTPGDYGRNAVVIAKRQGVYENDFPTGDSGYLIWDGTEADPAGREVPCVIGVVARASNSAWSNAIQAVFIPLEAVWNAKVTKTIKGINNWDNKWFGSTINAKDSDLDCFSSTTKNFITNITRIKHRIYNSVSNSYFVCKMNAPSLEDTIDIAITQYDTTFKIEENNLYYGKNNWHNKWTKLLEKYKEINDVQTNYTILPIFSFVQEWSKVTKNTKFSETSTKTIDLSNYDDFINFSETIKYMCDTWNSLSNGTIDSNTESGLYIDTDDWDLDSNTKEKVIEMYTELINKLSMSDVSVKNPQSIRFDNNTMNTWLLTRWGVDENKEKSDCDLCLRYHLNGSGWLISND